MGLFNRFPYTNFHELNLDWIIEKVKEMNAQAVKVSSEANNKSTESLEKSSQALTTSENALNTANGSDEKATQALNNSTSALNTANTANRSSSQALSQSKSALDTANGIDEKATRALDTANGIDEKATQALDTANGSNEKATRALNNSTSALNTANTANRSSSQALSQSKSALNTANEKYGGLFTGDLNNLKKPGTYYCAFSNTTNSPYTSENFGLVEVLSPSKNEEIYIQRITLFSNETSGTLTVNMSYRFYLDARWYPWIKLLVNSAV